MVLFNEKHDYCTVFTCILMCSPRSYCIRSARLSSSTRARAISRRLSAFFLSSLITSALGQQKRPPRWVRSRRRSRTCAKRHEHDSLEHEDRRRPRLSASYLCTRARIPRISTSMRLLKLLRHQLYDKVLKCNTMHILFYYLLLVLCNPITLYPSTLEIGG